MKTLINKSIKYFLIIFFSFVIVISTTHAQDSYVRAGYSAKENAVVVKWYQDNNNFAGGVNVYRKDASGSWVKLNDKPLQRPAKMSKSDGSKGDSLSAVYNYIIYNKPKDAEELENYEFTLIIYALLDNNFAYYTTLGYADKTAEQGKTYSYKVVYLKSGSEVELGVSEEVTSGGLTQAPANAITAVQNMSKVLLNWSPDNDKYIAYNVYRDGTKINKDPVMILDVSSNGKTIDPGNRFSDSTITDGATYSYSYTALDGFGNESPQSASVQITITSTSLPPKPTNVTFDGNGNLTLSWKFEPAGNLAGFSVFRGEDVKSEFIKLNTSLLPVSQTTFIDETAEMNKKYFYYVASETNSGLRNMSSVIAASKSDYSKPMPPQNVAAESDSQYVYLKWNKSASGNVIGYKVYRNIKGRSDEFLLLTPLPLEGESYVDTLSTGALNNFYYSVVAVNQVYLNSDYSDIAEIKLKDVVPPAAPVITDLTVTGNSVAIEWIPSFDTDIAGYKVYRSEDSASGFVEVSSSIISNNTYTDNNLTPDKTYYYKISAIDNSQNASMSDAEQVFIVSVQEEIKIPVTITASFNQQTNSIDLNWNYQSSVPVKGVVILRRDNNEEASFIVSDVLNVNNFSDTGIEPSSKYFYSVQLIFDNDEIITSEEQSIDIN